MMKQGQSSKRARGRNSGGRRGGNRQHTFDSNGPSVRIRGNAFQVYEKYLGLARDAASSSDRIAAENYYQHAEHYFRIYSAEMEDRNQRLAANGQGAEGQRRQNQRGHRGNGRAPANGANGASGADADTDGAQIQVDAPVQADAQVQADTPAQSATEVADANAETKAPVEDAQPAPKRTPRRRNSAQKGRPAAKVEASTPEESVPPRDSETDPKPVAGD